MPVLELRHAVEQFVIPWNPVDVGFHDAQVGHRRREVRVHHRAQVIDKNSLWGELNIQKGELCVKGFLSQHLGFVWGPFQQGFGGIWG
jgi:hypothetical protein